MAQSTTTVTPGNPTPPTNLSFVGNRPPLDPAQAAVDDGLTFNASTNFSQNEVSANWNTFAASTAAANTPGAPGAGISVTHEGRGNETLFTQTYNSPQIYAPIPLKMDGCGPALTPGTMPNPNALHASYPAAPTLASISPTTSVHATASITMTATGTNFTPNSRIVIGGNPQPTTFVSTTSLTCIASPPASAGTVSVTVVDGASTTAAQTWTIS